MAGETGNTLQSGFLNLVLCAKSLSNIATVVASTTIWVALHTADPLAGGSQNTSEAAFPNYARIATDRSTATLTGGWNVTGNSPASASPITNIAFPTANAATAEVETFFSVGLSSAGAGTLLWAGPLTPNVTMANAVTVTLTTATAITQA